MARIFGTLLVVAVLAVAGAFVFIYSGAYNIAASQPHSALGRWVLSTTMQESVKRRAADVAPPSYELSTRVEAGFTAYEDMCVPCHGAPGVEASALGKGLTPPAPDLAKSAEHWSPTEIFWIVKHGIKMTGMPAWGETHTDRELWDVVAFVERLPSMSPQDYQTLRQAHAGNSGGHDHGEAGH